MIETLERAARLARESTNRIRKAKPWQQLGHILVASDLSDDSMKAVRFAAKLAKRFNSRLTLMYVCEVPRSLEFMRGRHTMEVMEKHVELAYERFEQLCRCIRAQHRNFEMYFRVGNTHDEIVWAADALNADLLVMPAEECNSLGRAINGPDVKRILRDARCPVLLVHKKDRSLTE
jgi:nucleotide-binding universal stress UspA family protein